MSDRLSELRRQRALAQEQVAWFDREIARESGGGPLPAKDTPPAGAPLPPSPETSPLPPEANTLLRQYQSSTTNIRSEVKRGCLIYFFAAFALLALGITVYAFFWAKSHGYTLP